MYRFWLLLLAALLVLPRPAAAQREPFLQAIQNLASASATPGRAGDAAVADAVRSLSLALDGWDQALAAQAARADGPLREASTEQQFQSHVALALAYRMRGRLADALREFDAAADLQPASSDLQVLRALTLESADRRDEAARAFHTGWLRDVANPVKAYYVLQHPAGTDAADIARARHVMTQAYEALRLTDTRPAVPPFVTLDAIPDTWSHVPIVGDVRTGEAFALLAGGRYDEALARLHSGAAEPVRQPPNPLARFHQAQADERENRVSEAREGYLASLGGALAGRSSIYVAIARLAQVEGDVPGAVDAFKHAVSLNPNDQTMRQELATAYVAADRVEDAFAELVAGLLVNPVDATLHAAIGQLRLEDGHPGDAVPALTRALELSPDHYEVRYALATALSRLGKTDEAARQLELFERTRRERLDRRRQDIQNDVDKEDALRTRSNPGRTP